MALRLAKAGYYGGDPAAVLDAPAPMVLQIMQFEEFTAEYEAACYDLAQK